MSKIKAQIPDLSEPVQYPYFYIEDKDLHIFFKVCNELHLFAGIVDMDYCECGEHVKVACDTPYRLTFLIQIMEKFDITIYRADFFT